MDPLPHGEPGLKKWSWWDWARPDQRFPAGDWTTWLILAGRGAGKTRAGAEWVRAQVEAGARHVALVAETFEDAREVMVEGPAGLCAVHPPHARPRYEPSRHRLVWPCGAVARLFSASDPEGLRGYQHEAAWSDELAKWPDAEAVWSNLQLGLRLGDRPRQVVTTTPRPMPLIKALMNARTTVTNRASTYQNAANLAGPFLTEIARSYEGTALGRQELMGELVEDRAGALWRWSMIEAARVEAPPPLDRIVVAVDPPVTSGKRADACGLVVAGLAKEGLAEEGGKRVAYVLEDATARGLTAAAWGARAVELYQRWEADRIVAEVNQGGEMVAEMIRLTSTNVPIRQVRARRGKTLRAEPVAALYERGLVRHVGPLPALEAQMTTFTGAPGEASPDRLDALVWALTDLMLGPAIAQPRVYLM